MGQDRTKASLAPEAQVHQYQMPRGLEGEQRRHYARELLQQIREEQRLNPKAYEKKYGEPIERTLNKAREGNRGSICQLIAWDKLFLAEPAIIEKIRLADEKGNNKFLHDISAAVKRHGKPNKLRKHQRLLDFLAKAVEKLGLNEKQLTKFCQDWLEPGFTNGGKIADDDPTLNLLRDIKELPKFIKRNKHLIFK